VDDEECGRLPVIGRHFDRDDLELPATFVGSEVVPCRIALVGRDRCWCRSGHDVAGGGPTDSVASGRLRESDPHWLRIVSDTIYCVKQK